MRTSGVGGARTNRMLYHIIMLRYARGIGSHKKEKPIPSGRCENYRMGLWGKEMSKIRTIGSAKIKKEWMGRRRAGEHAERQRQREDESIAVDGSSSNKAKTK